MAQERHRELAERLRRLDVETVILAGADMRAVPDVETARIVPWHDRTALLLCDFVDHDGDAVPLSPRAVLRSVVERARAMGVEPIVGVELEFYVLRETPRSVLAKRPSQLVAVDERPGVYGVVAGSRHEPFASAVKEIAALRGLLATFMAKPRSDWPGSSCHLHLSLGDGTPATMRHFIGGLLETMAELTAVLAPTPNSYRRFAPYSWAATTATWSMDNRSAGVRALATRVEHRQSGADAIPCLAVAAALAAGDLLERSALARDWLGNDVVEHCVAMRRAELAAQAAAVTDWETARYLEAM